MRAGPSEGARTDGDPMPLVLTYAAGMTGLAWLIWRVISSRWEHWNVGSSSSAWPFFTGSPAWYLAVLAAVGCSSLLVTLGFGRAMLRERAAPRRFAPLLFAQAMMMFMAVPCAIAVSQPRLAGSRLELADDVIYGLILLISVIASYMAAPAGLYRPNGRLALAVLASSGAWIIVAL